MLSLDSVFILLNASTAAAMIMDESASTKRSLLSSNYISWAHRIDNNYFVSFSFSFFFLSYFYSMFSDTDIGQLIKWTAGSVLQWHSIHSSIHTDADVGPFSDQHTNVSRYRISFSSFVCATTQSISISIKTEATTKRNNRPKLNESVSPNCADWRRARLISWHQNILTICDPLGVTIIIYLSSIFNFIGFLN